MKLGFVVQRYGMNIAGGAELHCRLVAEHLLEHHQVEVFTTCAKDYETWKNEYPSGKTTINSVIVHRFPVKNSRNTRRFFDVQNLVFNGNQSVELEEKWIRENGPYCPKLVKKIIKRNDIDCWILFSYRYWTTVECLRKLNRKTILVPTAEHDPALHLNVFKEIFNLPGAIAYNSYEEKGLIQQISDNNQIDGEIVGVGLVTKTLPDEAKTKELFGKYSPYLIYVGRIDKNKGCDHLFRQFTRFCREVRNDIKLLLVGKNVIDIPEHPNIIHLGYLSETQKMAAIMRSEALISPSPYESLSMVLLEAWRVGRPVIVNQQCEVLEGQCLRSNGGLAYRGYEEFSGAIQIIVDRSDIAESMGKQGNHYYNQHYQWKIIKEKYEQLLNKVVKTGKDTEMI